MEHHAATLKAATIAATYASTMRALRRIKAEAEDEKLQFLPNDAIPEWQVLAKRHGWKPPH